MAFKISIGNMSKSRELGDWYLDYSFIVDLIQSGFYGKIDRNGIPLVDYDKVYKKNRWYFRNYKNMKFGVHYTPVTIAQYAFGLLYKYNRDNVEKELSLFKKCADWFVANIKDKGDYGVWEYTCIQPVYDIKPPWISAIAQGEAISVLLRAYQIFNNEEYLTTAKKAFNSFKRTDIVYLDEDKNIWYEEYPNQPHNHVLNGFIFALLGLFDFYRLNKDSESFELWTGGIKTLEKNIGLYDSGYWSRYDLLYKRIVGDDYHNIHIYQLTPMICLFSGN